MEFFDENTHQILNSLIGLLEPFEEATRLLSCEDTNLVTADLILMNCLNKITVQSVRQSFHSRVLNRRNKWSDILLYLQNEHHGVDFFQMPHQNEIIDIYNKVNFIKFIVYIYFNSR